jgi:predicted heme/steroid binding protein
MRHSRNLKFSDADKSGKSGNSSKTFGSYGESRFFGIIKLSATTKISILIALAIIGVSLVQRQNKINKVSVNRKDFTVASVMPPSISQNPTPGVVLSLEELKTQDGKNSNKCFVAVDGTVYQVIQGRLWNEGVHDSSNMQAYCGQDLSSVIDKSPHGRAKLEQMYTIGRLKQ